uniref:Uncharacterized protein n=1 Tax=Branchiostoma floridae TaxID=7739 RepID=C3Y6X6_BRAFL|eukprot:XP_002608076.1 hypothetical protein BRAFLDRAFT_91446 [Branchiostoma floridae]
MAHMLENIWRKKYPRILRFLPFYFLLRDLSTDTKCAWQELRGGATITTLSHQPIRYYHCSIMIPPLLLIVAVAVFAPEVHGRPTLTQQQGDEQQGIRQEQDGGIPTESTPHPSRDKPSAHRVLSLTSSVGSAMSPRRPQRDAPPRRDQKVAIKLRHLRRTKPSNKKFWQKFLSMRRMANLSYLAFPIAYLMDPPRG